MRLALGIEYNGEKFSGWERQRDQPTVQAELERALSRVADSDVSVVCAGRTDSGVHAVCQVVHFDCDAERPLRAWTLGANSHLPRTVTVNWASPVSDDFHARFSARRRHYRYVILDRSTRPGLLHGRVGWSARRLDDAVMHEAAQALLGEHDFSSFRAAGCQARNPVRTMHRLDVTREHAFVLIDVSANAFLQHMVRNIVGSLLTVGLGKNRPSWMAQLLRMRDRTQGAMTMSAAGLYFVGVEYPPEFNLPRVPPAPALW